MKKLLLAVALLSGCLSETNVPDDSPTVDEAAQAITVPDALQAPATFCPGCSTNEQCVLSGCGHTCLISAGVLPHCGVITP
jgi:hypothetical protein